MVYTMFVFYGLIGKPRWPPWPLDCSHLAILSLLAGLYGFWVVNNNFEVPVVSRKVLVTHIYLLMVRTAHTALSISWLKHFWLLRNRWMKFKERILKEEGRSRRPLSSFWGFFCRWENQDGCPGLWVAETVLTSSLQLLNRIQWKWGIVSILPTSLHIWQCSYREKEDTNHTWWSVVVEVI